MLDQGWSVFKWWQSSRPWGTGWWIHAAESDAESQVATDDNVSQNSSTASSEKKSQKKKVIESLAEMVICVKIFIKVVISNLNFFDFSYLCCHDRLACHEISQRLKPSFNHILPKPLLLILKQESSRCRQTLGSKIPTRNIFLTRYTIFTRANKAKIQNRQLSMQTWGRYWKILQVQYSK